MKRRSNLSWLDATKLVLSSAEKAMCQTQILHKISELGLKDTSVQNSGDMIMRTLLSNSAGKNPLLNKVEDKKFTINPNYKTTSFSRDITYLGKRQLPQRKKTKIISDDFVNSESLVDSREEKISYSPYSSQSIDCLRKNKRMRIRAVVTPKAHNKPAVPAKDTSSSGAQPSEKSRNSVQEMLNGSTDIMKYEVIAKKCICPDEFSALSKCQQRYLASHLPSSDVRKERNTTKLLPSALSNPFFVAFFREWQDRLGKGELSAENKSKIAAEIEKQVTKNPWKETFFEDVWGFNRSQASADTKTHRTEDRFEESIKEALSAVPPTFFIPPIPIIDPIIESLTPPTSDGSEHDRSHITNSDLNDQPSTPYKLNKSPINILTPDHEMDKPSSPESVFVAEPVYVAEPVVVAEPVYVSEPVFVAEPVFVSEPVLVAEPECSEQLESTEQPDVVPEVVEDEKPPYTPVSTEEVSLPNDAVVSPLQTTSNDPILPESVEPIKEDEILPDIVDSESIVSDKFEPTSLYFEMGLPEPEEKPDKTDSELVEVTGSVECSEHVTKSPNVLEDNQEISFADLDLDDHHVLPSFEMKPPEFPGIDDPDLVCDFIIDKSCKIVLERTIVPAYSENPLSKVIDEIPPKLVTKLTVSDDISLNIMNEIKDFKVPPKYRPCEILKTDLGDIKSPLAVYDSSASSTASSPHTDGEKRERITLKILKKDIILPSDDCPYSPKSKKSKKHKGKERGPKHARRSPEIADHVSYPQQKFTITNGNQFGLFKQQPSEMDLNLNRISLQQQLLAEKGIKTSSAAALTVKNYMMLKNTREKQQNAMLPKLTKAPSNEHSDNHQPMEVLDSGSQKSLHSTSQKTIPTITNSNYKQPSLLRTDSSESVRSALKAKINQRRFSDTINLDQPPPQYTPLSSGNHCCYVVNVSSGDCECSRAPMLFCTKCYHLSHSLCSNVVCSNCGALFKFT